jgi:hypothetical protein
MRDTFAAFFKEVSLPHKINGGAGTQAKELIVSSQAEEVRLI